MFPFYKCIFLYLDINECQDTPDVCDDNATCNNTIGSYTCTCNEGFTGEGSNGTCEGNIFIGGPVPPNYYPATCLSQTYVRVAPPSPQYFVSFYSTVTWVAIHMFILITYVDINECEQVPLVCDDNATCNNTIGNYSCTCNEGFSGEGEFGTCEGTYIILIKY